MKYFSERLNFWEKNIKNILKKIKEKNVYSEGITAVITGKTNVGKSSLLNTLLNEDRAIVTDIAGTTRDTLDAYINIKGIPLKIIDTAGIRSNPDSIEQIGISKTFKSIEKADIILFIADNSSNLTNEDIEILERLKNKKILILVNKSDIDRKLYIKFFSKYEHIKLLQISSKTRLGINNLINTIYDFIKRDMDVIAEKIYVNIRQKEALKNAVTHIEKLKVSVLQERAFDFLTIDLNSTLNELGRLTGETVSADIINEIFGRFCIGK